MGVDLSRVLSGSSMFRVVSRHDWNRFEQTVSIVRNVHDFTGWGHTHFPVDLRRIGHSCLFLVTAEGLWTLMFLPKVVSSPFSLAPASVSDPCFLFTTIRRLLLEHYQSQDSSWADRTTQYLVGNIFPRLGLSR